MRTSRRVAACAAGVVLLAGFSSVPASAAPTWRPPVTLSDPAITSSSPEVAADAAGNAVAVWRSTVGANGVIKASFHPASGGGWSPPVSISDPAVSSSTPQVAMAATGEVLAVWLHNVGPDAVLEGAIAPFGGTWSQPETISVTGVEAAAPRLAVNASGDATVVWWTTVDTELTVEAARRPPGGSWGAPEDVYVGAFLPDVAVDASGRAILVMRRTDAPGVSVIAAMDRSAGGDWGLPQTLDTAGSQPQVAVDPGGSATAVWLRFDGAWTRTQTSSRVAGGSWSTSEPISPSGEEVNSADVAVAPNGDATAVWRGLRATTGIAEAAFHPLGGFWGPALDLSDGTASVVAPRVAVDDVGTATAVWQEGDKLVRASRRPSFGLWSGPTPVLDAAESVTPASVRVAVSGTGEVVAVWAVKAGTPTVVQAAGLDVAGPSVALTLPAKLAAGTPTSFSATAGDAWSDIASYAWSFGDQKTGSGPTVSHTYVAPGSYTVSVTVTDASGNATTRTASVEVGPPMPVIKKLRLSDATIAKGDKTVLTIKLNTAAKVRLLVKGKAHGVKAKLSKQLSKGTSRIRLTTKIGGKTLVPDTYVIKATATNASGVSKKKSVTLKVIR